MVSAGELELSGELTVTAEEENSYAIYSSGTIIINENSNLNVIAKGSDSTALFGIGDITFAERCSAAINATGSDSVAVYGKNKILIYNSDTEATGTRAAFRSDYIDGTGIILDKETEIVIPDTFNTSDDGQFILH